jgi:mRNA interferase HigB
LGNGSSRVIFNIAGNHYRMICKYQFEGRCVRLYIKWIGTHAEYSKLCKKSLQYSVNNY